MQVRDAVGYGIRFAANALNDRPRTLFLEVTRRCNAPRRGDDHDRRRGELVDYAPIVARLAPFRVTFTGGEPLLRREIADLVRGVTGLPDKPYTALVTNGWLLGIERARALRAAGLEQITLPVDFIGEAHDRARGLPGLYRRVEARIPDLLSLGFRVVVRTTIQHANVDELVPLARLTARWGVAHAFSAPSPRSGATPAFTEPRQLAALRRAVAELRSEKRRAGHIVSSDSYLDNLIAYVVTDGRLGERCRAAGSRFLHVDPWGYVSICAGFEPFAHWTELDWKRPAAHDCTGCWDACRGESEAPMSLGFLRDLVRPSLLRAPAPPHANLPAVQALSSGAPNA